MRAKSIICGVAALSAAIALSACGSDPAVDNGARFNIYMPDGAPAIAMAELMHTGYYDTEFTVVPASTIGARVTSGDADIAIMPINAAAALYNGGNKIKMLSVNTHGNLYFVGDPAENTGLGDLVGKRVGVIGQGQVPDLTLRMMLDGSEIGYEVITDETAKEGKVAIRYGADGPSLLPLLKQKKIDYAFLAEPAATTAVNNFQKAIVMDAQQEWEKLFGTGYPQACLIARDSVIEEHPEYVKWLLRALESSDGWAAEHPDKTVAAVKAHMIDGTETSLPATLTREVIERCNISTVSAADAKSSCAAFFAKLNAMQTELGKPVLGKIPDDGFYYSEDK